MSFSESRVSSWLLQHSAKTFSGDTRACDDYSDDVEVMLHAEERGGHWEVEGGKAELCDYQKKAVAAFTLLNASTNSEFQRIEVVRSGFPWLSARVTYHQRTQVSAPSIPPLTVSNDDTVVLVRTFSGLKIKKVDSKSKGWL